jgi:16S rRNA (guanine527-N7)-methyltransferase
VKRARVTRTRKSPGRSASFPGARRSSRAIGSSASVLARQPWTRLDATLARIPGCDPAVARARLERFAALLVDWNRSVSNLISKNDEERFVTRHLVESLGGAAPILQSGATYLLDFGSGGGLPALPLAIAGVGSRWTLVESRRMKTLFLRKACEELQLASVDVICSRLETLLEHNELPLGSFDGFTSRATLRLGPTLRMASSLVRPGGMAFLWKGERLVEELRDPEWAGEWTERDVIPVGDESAVVVTLERKQD